MSLILRVLNDIKLIPNYQAKFTKELAGIFNFAMEGYKRLKENKFVFSKSKTADKLKAQCEAQYSSQYDIKTEIISAFIKDCITQDKDKRISNNALYKKFIEWCDDSVIFKKKLRMNGVTIISVTENLDDSPESIMLESVIEGMAQYYSSNLAREVRKGQRETALQHKHLGGTPPLFHTRGTLFLLCTLFISDECNVRRPQKILRASR